MADVGKFLEFQYQEIEVLDEVEGISLVQDRISGRIFQKRIISCEEGDALRTCRGIRHSNLVGIEEVFRLENVDVVIEEYVNGWTLGELQQQQPGGRFPEYVAETYIRQICAALGELHKQNLVHRKISPDTVMITTNGIVKVAHPEAIRRADMEKERDTVCMGIAGYAAPEQFGFGQSDARSDIYAVGVLWNILLTGCLPSERLYHGRKSLQRAIRQCIQLDKERRYKNTEELLKELERSQGGYYVRKLYLQMPGLRSEHWYCKLLAFAGYSVCIFGIIGISAMMFLEYDITLYNLFYLICVLFFEWLLPWGVIGNVGNYEQRLFHAGKLPCPLRIALRLALAFFIFVFGSFLDAALGGEFLKYL